MANDVSSAAGDAVSLLALDGGGIRGISELLILDEIMRRIQYDLKLAELPRPCDYFDLIGGTSTGGLIALMLGRLRMSTDEALRTYNTLAQAIFSKENKKRMGQDGLFKATTLEDKVKELVSQKNQGERMLNSSEHTSKGKAFVCAMPANNMAYPRLFRTYPVRALASANCEIWEAARATSAAPTFFKRIAISDGSGAREEFIDGGLGCNNPAEMVLEEARNVFGNDRRVSCLVTIGTGHPGTIGLARPDSFQKVLPTKLIGVLKGIATDCEKIANNLGTRYQDLENFYFRFSIIHGAEGISLEEWKKIGELTEHTKAYLADIAVSKSIDRVVAILCNPRTTGWTLRSPGGIARKKRTSHWTVPFGRNHDFVQRTIPRRQDREERDLILDWLLRRIPPDLDENSCQRTAIQGLGGVGKTQIALEAAFCVRDQYPDCSVFWVPALDNTTFENAYREIGQKLMMPGISEDNADVKLLVKHALSHESSGSWLLIIDNADDTELLFGKDDTARLCEFLPFSQKGSILLTTRNKEVIVGLDIPKRNSITISEMTDVEASEMLQTNLEPKQTSDSESTAALLKLLTYLPLAIKQASAYMFKTSMSTSRYLQHCRSNEKTLINLLSKEAEYEGRYTGISNAVAVTWLISFQHISRDNSLASRILKIICFLATTDIPVSLFLYGEIELEVDEAIGILKSYAFVTHREDLGLVNIHQLVQLTMRTWLEQKGEREEWVKKAIRLLAHVFPFPKHENRDVWRALLPHALTAVRFQTSIVGEPVNVNLLFNIAESHAMLGKFENAEQMQRQTLSLREKVLGTDHPDTLGSMNNLAIVLQQQGKYEETEKMLRQTLSLREKVLGTEHPDTLGSMNNLTIVLEQQGKYEEAEKMQRQTLSLKEKVLGTDHPSTLSSMNNLAEVLRQQRKYEEAEKIQRQTLSLREKVLGTDHPDTLGSMNNLAIVLEQQGKYEETEKMQRQTLSLREKVLGTEHPDTLGSMNNLTIVLQQQGKYEVAEKILRQTLSLEEKVLGTDHPSTLGSMNNLAEVLRQQGKYEEAEKMQRQTLSLREKVLGTDHPGTLSSMNNLVVVLQQQGKYEETEKMLRQTLSLREKVLGTDHPDTLGSMNNLAIVLQQQGKYEEAEKMQRQTLSLKEKVLGTDHPSTLSSMNNLAEVLRQQRKYEEAEKIQRQTLSLREKVLGTDHPDTLGSMNNLAIVLQQQRKYEEAEKIQRQTLSLKEKVLGTDHPSTLGSMNNLTIVLRQQGKYEELEQRQ